MSQPNNKVRSGTAVVDETVEPERIKVREIYFVRNKNLMPGQDEYLPVFVLENGQEIPVKQGLTTGGMGLFFGQLDTPVESDKDNIKLVDKTKGARDEKSV